MKSIAIFRSDAFDLDLREGDGDPNEPPLGKDLAQFLATRLKNKGVQVSEPIEGNAYWILVITGHTENFWLFVHWAALDTPPGDWWVVQSEVRRSWIQRIFGRRPDSSKLVPLCELLHSVIESDPRITALQCLEDQELEMRY